MADNPSYSLLRCPIEACRPLYSSLLFEVSDDTTMATNCRTLLNGLIHNVRSKYGDSLKRLGFLSKYTR